MTEALATQYEAGDLDQIDRGGALRLAAETLVAEAESETHSQAVRDVAADALARLHAYVQGAKT